VEKLKEKTILMLVNTLLRVNFLKESPMLKKLCQEWEVKKENKTVLVSISSNKSSQIEETTFDFLRIANQKEVNTYQTGTKVRLVVL
jgi:hypothetical protein